MRYMKQMMEGRGPWHGLRLGTCHLHIGYVLLSLLWGNNFKKIRLPNMFIYFNFQVILESLRMANIISFTFREAVVDVEYKGKDRKQRGSSQLSVRFLLKFRHLILRIAYPICFRQFKYRKNFSCHLRSFIIFVIIF